MPQGWAARQEELLRLARAQLFFVGGAPRSGTTWIQLLLDSHPAVSCSGEGLFMKHLAEPLDALMTARREAVRAKNETVFRQSGGYRLPEAEDADIMLGTGIMLALARQSEGKACHAVGEKTPENVFFFPRLKRLFPSAKFIGIARDPRDVLASAWHFFRAGADQTDTAAKAAFIASALPSLDSGARALIALTRDFPSDCTFVTYETMLRAPQAEAARLFRFLGVTDQDDIIADCVARTAFSALAGGRDPGAVQAGSFFRRGVAGDWRATFTPEMNATILHALGWMYPHFGWQP